MKISIIMPCYNAERYLGECLDSVLSQSETDFEVIVVDDGSQDGTLVLARLYQQRDKRIRVYHQQNAGVSAARNLGLAHAQGEWITFVDSDDLLGEDALEVMLSAASDAVDLVVSTHETFDEQGKREIVRPETLWMNQLGENKRRAVALRLIEGDSVLNIMCNKLHRRSLIERERIRLEPGVAIAEDALFNLEAVLCGRDIAYVDRVTYRYRIHGQSATKTRAASEFDVHRPWFLAMRSMLERRRVMETYYSAYVDSVVLRLYKDGGIPGAVRGFARKAKPLLVRGQMDTARMSMAARALLMLCESGVYACVYPALVPFQIMGRKLAEAAFILREKRENTQ